MNSKTFLTTNATYSNSLASDFHSHRYYASLALTHTLTPGSRVGLQALHEKVFISQDAGVPDFSIDGAVARFDAHGSRTTLTAEVGFTRLRQDALSPSQVLIAESLLPVGETLAPQGAFSSTQPLFRLVASRTISPSSAVSLEAIQEFMTSEDVLREGTGTGAPVGFNSPLATPDPFRQRSLAARWDYTHLRNTFELNVSYRRDDYPQRADLDRKETVFTGYVGRRLTQTLTAAVSGSVALERYNGLDVDHHENYVRAELDKHFSLRLTGILHVDRFTRTGPDRDTNYADNRVGVGITYALIAPR